MSEKISGFVSKFDELYSEEEEKITSNDDSSSRTEIDYLIPRPGITGCSVGLASLAIVTITLCILFYPNGSVAMLHRSCKLKPCMSSLNLVCIANTCQCLDDEYYVKSCQKKNLYLEKCNGNNESCLGNLKCIDGICKCNENSYWENGTCLQKRGYGQPCLENKHCLSSLILSCSLIEKKCSCSANRYFYSYSISNEDNE